MSLERILQEFKSRDEVTRAHAKEAFQRYVFTSSKGSSTSVSSGPTVNGSVSASSVSSGVSASASASGSNAVSVNPGQGGRIDASLLSRCITLCSSSDVNDKLAGVSAIDAFCDLLAADELNSAHKLAANVLKALPSPDAFLMAAAAKTYARLASIGSLLMVGPVTMQLKQSIEWLQGERVENRRWAGVLLVRELSRTVPNLLYDHLADLIDNVWYALRDAKVAIREAAAGALDGILKISYDRDHISERSIPHFDVTYQEACKSFHSNEHIHGALLGYQELFLRAGLYMQRHYDAVCRAVLSLLDHKDPLVRIAVTNLLPVLAQYDPETFVREHHHKAMMHLLTQIKLPKDRERAFDAVGLIAIAVGHATAPYLEAILAACRENLQQQTKASARKQAASESAVFLCIARLGAAVGPLLQKHMHDLFDLMVSYGLSEPLVEALAQLSRNIPSLLQLSQLRLLDLISNILAAEPFRKFCGINHGTTPTSRSHPVQTPHSAATAASSQMNGHVSDKDPATLCLALDTLGTFDFTRQTLTEFISTVVVHYLDDDAPAVRMSAVRTTARLMASGPAVKQTSAHSVKLVSDVLDKLLAVAVSDPEANIRRTTLLSLDPCFDRHLAQSDKIRALWVAMNDESFASREVAMAVLGRLAAINPAYIMPSLRKTLIQLLTEIEHTSKDQEREQATILLNQLISTSNRITKPYVVPMLKVLLPKAHDRNLNVATAMMNSLGSLAKVGGEDVLPRLGEYMELIVATIGLQSSPAKREAALRALGQLCGNAGYVVQPWLDYPHLLGTFIQLMQAEPRMDVKREVVRTMGIIGALDPYRYTAVLEKQASENPAEASLDPSTSFEHIAPASDDLYSPAVAFKALLAILRDPSLSAHHTAVVEAIMYIFRSLRLKCVQFLPQIVPAFLGAMRSCPPRLEEYYIQNLGHLIATVKQHIRPYLDPILTLINELWAASAGLQTILVELMESVATALGGEFKISIPQLLPLVLQAFETDHNVSSSRRSSTQTRVLRAFGVFGTNLEEYLQLVLPSIVRTFELNENSVNVRVAAIGCVGLLCRKMNLSEHASRVVHPLARVLSSPNPDLKRAAMDALCAFMTQIDTDFAIFVPMINKAVVKNKIQHARYDTFVSKLLKGEPLPQDYAGVASGSDETDPAADAGTQRLPVNQQNLKSAWDTTGRMKADDWRDWLNRLAVQLLKSSPSHSLRACANLAEVYQPLARELFNAAFVSCWTELFDNYQDELHRSIEMALSASSVPSEVTQALLNLAEFMEHDDKMLPIHVHQLGSYAYHTHAYAKALHYREIEFFSSNSYEIIESLISITNQLHQRDSAMGILKFAQKQFDMTDMSAEWYEKLERWEDAYAAYERAAELDPDNFSNAYGRMKCLHALGEWDALAALAQDHWGFLPLENKRRIAPIAAAAAWGLQEWDMMDEFVSVMKHDSADRAWFRSVLYVHRGSYAKAQNQLNKARDTLITELASLTGESYGRGYSQVIRVQAMAELEEIIQYKVNLGNLPDGRERKSGLYKTWMKRLKGCEQDVDVWQRLLKVRALILTPRDSMDMWIKFANLCRKNGRMTLAEKTLNSLMGGEDTDFSSHPSSSGPPHVIYAHLKFMWTRGDKAETLSYLDDFTNRLAHDLGIGNGSTRPTELTQSGQVTTFTRLLARCYYKQASWSMELQDDWGSELVTSALAAYKHATILDPSWYKAWHSWALANSEVVSHFMRHRPETDQDPIPQEIFTGYLVPAVEAFFKSIALSQGDALQDTLRVLTLWFNFGHQSDVSLAVQQGFSVISIDTWLEVIPQLIARIHVPSQNVRRLVQQILVDVAKEHPQALVYSLTVASKYPSAPRRRAALNILERMREHSATMIDQGIMVSQELMRSAILWHEMWYEALEEASRFYFKEHNIEGMFAVLEPQHELLERGPETLREIAFEQMFGRDLHDARVAGRRFRAYGEIADLNTAWELYYGVYRRLWKLLPQITQVELEYAAPKLLAARDLELAVPGTYHPKRPIIYIERFAPSFDVIGSKQRPRKFKIHGSDGREHGFLLKGHEDIRQDERVMQLFGLINTLLAKDTATFKRHLWVQRYPAIPLSPNAGLLGWLPYTDTLHVLIKEYRESRKILVNIEQRLIQQMGPDYDKLCYMQKMEIYLFALDNTTGQDLYRILWLRSKTSEAWLDRRSVFSRTLAVSSIVGYILGLGDRHPCNILLSRENGTVIHIDYGDCFEVAMTRDNFPEKVPFRLTRMLQNAMDVSRIEGVFRTTCEHTMRVMRGNKDSVIAVLEAFSRDPLTNWRLVTGGRRVEATPNQNVAENPSSNYRRPKGDESTQMDDDANEILNQKALQVVERVTQKLTGRDFKANTVLPIEEQVDLLIKQATSLDNLSMAFLGWCAFW